MHTDARWYDDFEDDDLTPEGADARDLDELEGQLRGELDDELQADGWDDE